MANGAIGKIDHGMNKIKRTYGMNNKHCGLLVRVPYADARDMWIFTATVYVGVIVAEIWTGKQLEQQRPFGVDE